MGRATIISNLGDGQYLIKLEIDESWINHEISLLTLQIAQWPGIIAAHDTEIAAIQSIMDDIVTAQQSLSLPEEQEEWAALQEQYNNNLYQKQLKERLRLLADTKYKTAQKRKQQLEDYKSTKTSNVQVNAWCADLTTGLSGTVGTVEVPNERFNYAVQIRPGYSGSIFDLPRDGGLQPAMGADAAGVVYNLAMLPGKQRWRPQYRYAEITSIDWCAKTAVIKLEPAVSSQQILNVNPDDDTLEDVPVQYMEHNLFCFEEGDIVLVEYTDRDWDQPKIIGFKENPRSCTFTVYLRPEINGTALRYGGQQFSIKYTDYNGSPQEAGPFTIRGGTDTTKYQYCGPFDLSTWDKCTDVEVHLYADKNESYQDDTAITAWKAGQDPDTRYEYEDKMFLFYEEDAGGDKVFSTSIFVRHVSKDSNEGIVTFPSGGNPCTESSDLSDPWMHLSFWVWARMLDKDVWDTNGSSWYYPWGPSHQEVKAKDNSTGDIFSEVDSIYETFTAVEFMTLLENTEASIYNWNTPGFETDKAVVDYNFTGWNLPGTGMQQAPFSWQSWSGVGATVPANRRYVSNQFAFALESLFLFQMSVSWPNDDYLYYAPSDPHFIEECEVSPYVGPHNFMGLYVHHISKNVPDWSSLNPAQFLGTDVPEFTIFPGSPPFFPATYRNVRGTAVFDPEELGCLGKFIGHASGVHTFEGDSDPFNWVSELGSSPTDCFYIISDRENVVPNNITPISKEYYRDNLKFCYTQNPPNCLGGDRTVEEIDNDTWTFTLSNSTLPEIWF